MSPLDRLTRALGRRGAVLVMLGGLWVLQGIGIAVSPRTREPGAEFLFHEQLPIWLRFCLWAGTGLIAAWFAFLREPPGRDAPGFIALVIMPLERAASFGVGFALWAYHVASERIAWLPGSDTPIGYPRGLIGTATWLTIAGLIMVVAGWADPRNRALTHRPAGPKA